MDKNEALKIFIKKNIAFLTSEKATKSAVKELRSEFKKRMKLKSASFFTNQDVAKAVIKEIVRVKRSENPEHILQILKKIPFINEIPEERIKSFVVQNAEIQSSVLTKDDLSRIKSQEHIDEIEKKFEERAREKVQKEMEEERKKLEKLISETEREKKDLEKYRSELDELPPSIELKKEDLNIMESVEIDDISWWKKIGLIGNPFPPDFKGLIGIPEELYDMVVVRTKFVKSYLSKIEKDPKELLGTSAVIMGEYGSGKTTLLDFLAYKCGEKGTLPCKVKLMPSPDSDSIINEFLNQIGSELGKIIFSLSHSDTKTEYGYIDSLSKLNPIIDDFKKYGGSGLIIIIDGLHKGTQYFPQTQEFLQQIQTFHEYFVENGIPCGFFIAGSLFWEKEISDIPSLSGSITDINIIPELSEDDAVDAVVRRIKSFSPPGKSAPTIDKNSIRIAYRTLKERSQIPLTFRSFMKHIRDRLKVGNYDEIGIGVSSHFEMVKTIQEFLSSSDFRTQYESLIDEISHFPELRSILREVLPSIYQSIGIEETDPLFKHYKNIFNLLKTQSFIVKRKSPRNGPFVWAISPTLARVLKDIQEKYSISPSETLYSIFENQTQVIKKEAKTLYSALIAKTSEYSVRLKDSWPDISEKLEEIKNILNDIEQVIALQQVDNINISPFRHSCELLVGCILKSGGVSKTDIDTCEKYRSFWLTPDNIDDIIDLCKGVWKNPSSMTEAFGIIHRHSQIMEQLMDHLVQLTRGEAISRLVNRKLTSKEKTDIHEARNLFLNQSYRQTVDIVCTILEDNIRDVVFPLIRVIWGDNYTTILPSDIKDSIDTVRTRGHPRTKREAHVNFFYDISRSEYSKILFQRNFRKILFGTELTDIEFKKLKDTWELAFSLGDREAHRDSSIYFREHATEIGDVLRELPKFCEKFNDMVKRMLVEMEFSYERRAHSIVGRYNMEGVKTAEIKIENDMVQHIMKSVLSSISRNPRSAIPLSPILMVDGAKIEAQVAMINAMIRRELIEITVDLRLSVTEKGKITLEKLYH